jgi:predicted nucleic acid-binding protein
MKGFLVDNDLFFAALYEGHQNHHASRDCIDYCKTCGWAIAAETFLSGMRLLMNPVVMRQSPLSAALAWKVVSLEISEPNPARVVFASNLPDKELFAKAKGHKQVMDLWLVQLALEYGLRLATWDTAMVRNHPDICVLADQISG